MQSRFKTFASWVALACIVVVAVPVGERLGSYVYARTHLITPKSNAPRPVGKVNVDEVRRIANYDCGSKDVSKLVVEFAGVLCPPCRSLQSQVTKLAMSRSDVELDSVSLDTHNSTAQGTEALKWDHKPSYAAFHRWLMTGEAKTDAEVAKYEASLPKADPIEKAKAAFAAQKKLADKYGITGTPSFLVIDRLTGYGQVCSYKDLAKVLAS